MPDKVEKVNFGQIGPPPIISCNCDLTVDTREFKQVDFSWRSIWY